MASDESFSGFIRPEAAPMRDGGRFADITEVSERGVCRVMRGRRHGRWWALKCLQEEYAGDEVYRALLRKEFEVGIALQHPGIVNVAGLEDVPVLGLTLVMEWVDGADLDDWLKTHPSRSRRRKVFGQILDAVEYAHTHQTVHRDLKPSNILVTRSGEYVKLIDFGLSDTDSHAEFKQAAGTEGFVSPEQRAGGATDVRNDIYSLGRILLLMKPVRGAGAVARRCLRPIQYRYYSVDGLRRALRRRRVAGYWCVALAGATLIGAGVWLLLPKSSNEVVSVVQTPMEVSERVEESVSQPESVEAAVEKETKLDAEPTAVVQEEAMVPAASQPDEAAVNALIERGREAADRRMSTYDIAARLDTATVRGSLPAAIDDVKADVLKFVMKYVAREGEGFGEQMRINVERVISEHLNSRYFSLWRNAVRALPE